MASDDIVFTAYDPERDSTYTLPEGTPETIGRQHFVYRRPEMAGKVDCVKYAAVNTDVAFRDKTHPNRERLYCLGADPTEPDRYMVLVAEYDSPKTATIVTAWQSDNISTGVGEITYVRRRR